MGLNTTIVILNDALGYIKRDPAAFVKRLEQAIQEGAKGQWIPVGGHGNAAQVVETHHADYDVLVKVGGNCGSVVKD